jgi:uncharacterized protein YkwD
MKTKIKDSKQKIIKVVTAASLLLSTTLFTIPSLVSAETNISEVSITNPKGLIPVGLYPSEKFDSDKEYWVRVQLNGNSFAGLEENLNTEFSLFKEVTGTAYENRHINGVASRNNDTLMDITNWIVSFEANISSISYLGTHTYLKKPSDFALSPSTYKQLIDNYKQYKVDAPSLKKKINEVENYLNWLKSLSSEELITYFGEFNFKGTMSVTDISEYETITERLEILKFNMDIVDRLVFGRFDLPSIWVEPARRLIENQTSIGFISCDLMGYPRKYTTNSSPTIKYTAKVRATNVDYKMIVHVDGKVVNSTYDEELGLVSAPTKGLSIGQHTVEVFVSTPNDEISIVEWTFKVEKPTQNDTNNNQSNTSNENSNSKPSVSVQIEGKDMTFPDAKPLIKEGRTLAPIRAFFDSMGANVLWDSATKTVTSTLNKGNETTTITLNVDSSFMFKKYTDSSGKTTSYIQTLDVPSQIIKGSTYIPIRAAAEAFGYKLDWDSKTNSASLSYSGTMNQNDDSSYQAYEIIGDATLLNTFEHELFVLVNEERIKNKLNPFSLNVNLSLLARKKSEDMIINQYFDHISPTYGNPTEMLESGGFPWTYAGENIATGQSSANKVLDDWMSSPGHRANILNANFEQMGIGLVQRNGSTLWTQLFYTS